MINTPLFYKTTRILGLLFGWMVILMIFICDLPYVASSDLQQSIIVIAYLLVAVFYVIPHNILNKNYLFIGATLLIYTSTIIMLPIVCMRHLRLIAYSPLLLHGTMPFGNSYYWTLAFWLSLYLSSFSGALCFLLFMWGQSARGQRRHQDG